MKRPRIWIRRGTKKFFNELTGQTLPCWECMDGDDVADSYTTRAEAQQFLRGYDPSGFYCLECDEPNKAKELPDKWKCPTCGEWNDWRAERRSRRLAGER